MKRKKKQVNKGMGVVPNPDVPFEREAPGLPGEPDVPYTDADEAPVPGIALGVAIAEHFGIDPDNVTGFVVACEHTTEDGTMLSSAWSSGSPGWRLLGFVAELKHQLVRAVRGG